MIKKIIGILFALGVVALIAYTAIDTGSYRTLLPDDFLTSIGLQIEPVEVVEPDAQPQSAADDAVAGEERAKEAGNEAGDGADEESEMK